MKLRYNKTQESKKESNEVDEKIQIKEDTRQIQFSYLR